MPASVRHWRSVPAILAVTLAGLPLAAAMAGQAAAAVHPDRWPRAHWPFPADPALEHKVAALMAQMTVEEKVGQLICRHTRITTQHESRPGPPQQVTDAAAHVGGNRSSGSEGVVIPRIFMLDATVACVSEASVNAMVTGNTPPAVGVPLMIPVAGYINAIFIDVAVLLFLSFISRDAAVPIGIAIFFVELLIPIIIKPGFVRINNVLPFAVQIKCFTALNIGNETVLSGRRTGNEQQAA